MTRPTSIRDLELQGSHHIARAMKRESRILPPAAKKEDLEAMYQDLTARRAEALADVKKNGLIIIQEKFSQRGELYQVKVKNPYLTIAEQCEKQLVSLARQLAANASVPPEKKSTTDVLADVDKMLEGVN